MPRSRTLPVLVVEDEELVRRVVLKLLKSGGYCVLEATSGAEALQQWKSQTDQIDLLLTDMIMPGGMNGLELAEELK